MMQRKEILTWNDVDQLVDHLIPQFETEFDCMIMITHGGIIPGGLISEALNLDTILTAAVDFPNEMQIEDEQKKRPFISMAKICSVS